MKRLLSFVRGGASVLALLGLIAVTAPSVASAAGSSCLPGSIKSKLSQIRAKFGPVRIVSTHRPGARIRGTGKRSYHASCRAVDFHAPRGKYSQVVAWLKANHSGGVGTYSGGMHHIHIDNGSRVRFHKRVNGRGARVGKRGKRRYSSKRRNRKYSGKRGKKRYAYKSKRNGTKRKSARRARAAHPRNSNWKITAYSP